MAENGATESSEHSSTRNSNGSTNNGSKGASQWRPRWWVALTTILSFLLGFTILVNESLLESSDRPFLQIVAVGLMGQTFLVLALERFRKP